MQRFKYVAQQDQHKQQHKQLKQHHKQSKSILLFDVGSAHIPLKKDIIGEKRI